MVTVHSTVHSTQKRERWWWQDTHNMTSFGALLVSDLVRASTCPCDRVRGIEKGITDLHSVHEKIAETEMYLGWRLAVGHNLVGPLRVLQRV